MCLPNENKNQRTNGPVTLTCHLVLGRKGDFALFYNFKQTFVPPSHGGSKRNLALIGPAVSEEKMFEECGRATNDRACLYYKLTHEPKDSGELKINEGLFTNAAVYIKRVYKMKKKREYIHPKITNSFVVLGHSL